MEKTIKKDGNIIISYNDKGDATSYDWSAVRTSEGDATGGDCSAVRTSGGKATGGDWSAVMTWEGDAKCGEYSVALGSSVELGENSIGGILEFIGGDMKLTKVIVNGNVEVIKYEDYLKGEKKTIIIDGKTINISKESYEELKKQLI